MKNVRLYWWTPKQYSKYTILGRLNGEYYRYKGIPANFGDELSYFIVSKVLNTTIDLATKNEKGKLLGIGSILHQAQDNDIVWGSGINGKYVNKKVEAKNLNILSVRGPLTQAYLKECGYNVPDIFGDPAVLTPLFYSPKIHSKKKAFAYVPHFSELKHLNLAGDIPVINPTKPYKEVIDEIFNTELILSSSLHGVILAEAYGIPAVLIRSNENEPLFKYKDYYLGTGRQDLVFATSIEEGLRMEPMGGFKSDNQAIMSALTNWYNDY